MLHCLKAGKEWERQISHFKHHPVLHVKNKGRITIANTLILEFLEAVLTVIQQVCDVQAECGQDCVKHFEVFPKSRHEQQEARGSLIGSQVHEFRMIQLSFCGFSSSKNGWGTAAQLSFSNSLSVSQSGWQQEL